MNKRLFFIVNPMSGGGRCKEKWEQVLQVIKGDDLEFDYSYTECHGDAIRLASEATRQNVYDVIVAVGGDGTVNEVINGMMGSGVDLLEMPAFTIFPAGTGSDTVRTLGIDFDVSKFVDMINQGEIRKCDVGLASFIYKEVSGSRYFLNACDIGIGASVATIVNSMNQSNDKKSRKFKFFRTIIEQIFKFKSFSSIIMGDSDFTIETNTITVSICNFQYFGGGIKISPNSQIDDGKLDLITTTNISKLGLLGQVSRVYKGTHINHHKIINRSAKEFIVDIPTPQLLETDGEVVGMVSNVKFTAIEKVLKIIYQQQI